jgi:hypothetical protein
MATMQNRIDDAQFRIQTPLCKKCRNHIMHKFDPRNPLAPTLTCKVYGLISDDLLDCKVKTCERFDLDPILVETYKAFD